MELVLLMRAEDCNNFDDASSQSSFNSYKFSSFSYFSDRENDFNFSSKIEEPQFIGKTSKWTRFCPQVSMTKHCNALTETENDCSFNHHKLKMARVRSLVDLRSQLLHRSLVEEINKRRLFKTIGAVENIGYHEPGDFISENASLKRGAGRCVRHVSKQRLEW